MRYFNFVVLLFVLVLAGCGKPVEVPPAHVGKILGKNGYLPDVIPPSKFRMEPCWKYCDKLVTLEVSDFSFKEKIVVFMPEDKLNLTVDVRGTLSIPNQDSLINSLYDRVVSEGSGQRLGLIRAHTIYKIYGQQALRGIVRSELVKNNITGIIAQRETVGANIHAAISEKLKKTKTPLVLSRFELADVQPPETIVNAQKAAKEREIDIQKAMADAQVELVKAEKDLEIAQKNRLVEREKAEAIAEQNKIAAAAITPQLLAYRKLETAERIYTELAKSQNVVIVPADSSSFSDITGDAVLAKLLGKEIKR